MFSDLCDLPVYVHRSCQSGSKVKEATHYSVISNVRTLTLHRKQVRGESKKTMGSQISVFNEHESWRCWMAEGSKIYQQVDRGPRGVIQCQRYPLEMKEQVLLLRREAVSFNLAASKKFCVFLFGNKYAFFGNLFIFFCFLDTFF